MGCFHSLLELSFMVKPHPGSIYCLGVVERGPAALVSSPLLCLTDCIRKDESGEWIVWHQRAILCLGYDAKKEFNLKGTGTLMHAVCLRQK